MTEEEQIAYLKLKLADTEKLLHECISRQANPLHKLGTVVYQFDRNKVFLRSFASLSKAARCVGADRENIKKRCETGEMYKGYYWSYTKKCG
jgi:hypothetical protein